MKWTLVGGLGLWALFTAADAGFSWGWEARNSQGQCISTTAEREANVRRIDAALRGFVADDR